jgi:hypothetical protein
VKLNVSFERPSALRAVCPPSSAFWQGSVQTQASVPASAPAAAPSAFFAVTGGVAALGGADVPGGVEVQGGTPVLNGNAVLRGTAVLNGTPVLPSVPSGTPVSRGTSVLPTVPNGTRSVFSTDTPVSTTGYARIVEQISVVDPVSGVPALLDRRGVQVQGTSGLNANDQHHLTALKPMGGVRGTPPRGRPV